MLATALIPDALDACAKSVTLWWLGSTTNVAALVRFLASPLADYMAGAALDSSGGVRISP